MARRSFEFKTFGTVHASFDPKDFAGMTYAQVYDAVLGSLPTSEVVDPEDVQIAAELLHVEAAREIR